MTATPENDSEQHTARNDETPDARASVVPGRAAGPNDLGSIRIADSVVEKIAARAAADDPEAGAAAPRLLGRSLSGAGRVGLRDTSLAGLPKASVRVDSAVALVDLELSVLWPKSIPATTARVRDRVRAEVARQTGLHVLEVTITVTDLVTTVPHKARVQ
ncbi:MAG: Asp23/Gls24 family envelope stress response protein [Gordonia polyisoprenivorans]|nr:Asp23/Gls24 family envelope stress response protein [Gordonia polyisoprenivorans]